jgi:hypothetical protein
MRLHPPRPRPHAPYEHMTVQSLQPADLHLETAATYDCSASLDSFFICNSTTFNFSSTSSMSCSNAVLIKEPDCALIEMLRQVSRNGWAVQAHFNAHIFRPLLLPFQRENPRSNDWLPASICSLPNGSSSGGTIREIICALLKAESTTSTRKLVIG